MRSIFKKKKILFFSCTHFFMIKKKVFVLPVMLINPVILSLGARKEKANILLESRFTLSV